MKEGMKGKVNNAKKRMVKETIREDEMKGEGGGKIMRSEKSNS